MGMTKTIRDARRDLADRRKRSVATQKPRKSEVPGQGIEVVPVHGVKLRVVEEEQSDGEFHVVAVCTSLEAVRGYIYDRVKSFAGDDTFTISKLEEDAHGFHCRATTGCGSTLGYFIEEPGYRLLTVAGSRNDMELQAS